MSREELERMIVDASDGELNASEIEKLESELQHHPDLLQDYQAIMGLPDFADLYDTDLDTDRHQASIDEIKGNLYKQLSEPNSFEMVSLNWFRRYALAASLAIFAITSIFTFVQQQSEQVESEEVVEEMFYPVDETSIAESYVLYFEGLSDD